MPQPDMVPATPMSRLEAQLSELQDTNSMMRALRAQLIEKQVKPAGKYQHNREIERPYSKHPASRQHGSTLKHRHSPGPKITHTRVESRQRATAVGRHDRVGGGRA